MRCFIAIDIDDGIRTRIGDLQKELRRRSSLARPEVKWVEPSLIHLTLKFLGQVKDRDIGRVCQIVSEVAADREGFSIEVTEVGCFGSPARVLWAGVELSEELVGLQKEIDERLSEAGWGAEKRKYSAHLTVCRIKRPQAGRKLAELSKDYDDFGFGALYVDSVCVYKSELTKAGPVYTLISRNRLQQ